MQSETDPSGNIESYITEILKLIGDEELEVIELANKYGHYALKNCIKGNINLECNKTSLSPIARQLFLKTSFSPQDTAKLLNMALVIADLETGVTLLTDLLNKFICKHTKKEIANECRFIALYALLSHYDQLPKSIQRFDYIDILLKNINECFPQAQKPKKSLFSYLDYRCDKEYQPTVLHHACRFADIDLINFILQKDTLATDTLDKKNYEDKTPLMLLCEIFFKNHYGSTYISDLEKLNILLCIVTQFIKKNADLSLCDAQDNSILHYLFTSLFNCSLPFATTREKQCEPIVSKLFELCDVIEKHSPGLIEKANKNGNTSFHIFVQNIHTRNLSTQSILRIIHYFLQKNINICNANLQRETPLQMYLAACAEKEIDYEILSFLLSQGSSLYLPDDQKTYFSLYLSQKEIMLKKTPIKSIISFLSDHTAYLRNSHLYKLEAKIEQLEMNEKTHDACYIDSFKNFDIREFMENDNTFRSYLGNKAYSTQEKAKIFVELFIEQQIKSHQAHWESFLNPLTIDTETFKLKEPSQAHQKKKPIFTSMGKEMDDTDETLYGNSAMQKSKQLREKNNVAPSTTTNPDQIHNDPTTPNIHLDTTVSSSTSAQPNKISSEKKVADFHNNFFEKSKRNSFDKPFSSDKDPDRSKYTSSFPRYLGGIILKTKNFLSECTKSFLKQLLLSFYYGDIFKKL